MKFEFHLANGDIISQMFLFVYDSQPVKVTKEAEADHGVSRDLPRLAREFVAKIPKLEFSPAEIMSLSLANKQSPTIAMLLSIFLCG